MRVVRKILVPLEVNMSDQPNPSPKDEPHLQTPRGTGWRPQTASSQPAESLTPASSASRSDPSPPLQPTVEPTRTPNLTDQAHAADSRQSTSQAVEQPSSAAHSLSPQKTQTPARTMPVARFFVSLFLGVIMWLCGTWLIAIVIQGYHTSTVFLFVGLISSFIASAWLLRDKPILLFTLTGAALLNSLVMVIGSQLLGRNGAGSLCPAGIITLIAMVILWRGLATPADLHHQNVSQARSQARAVIRGEVRGFRERVEQHGSNQVGTPAPDIIWSFRVERYQDGHRLTPIPVEMRGVKLRGIIHEGDMVEIYDPWREGETIRPKQITNITTNTQVSSEKAPLGALGFCGILMVIWTIIVIGVIAMAVLLVASGFFR